MENINYIKELEANVDCLKEALDKERELVDYMINRKNSQKYRRWCFLRFVNFLDNSPEQKLDIYFTYEEKVFHCLDDMRGAMLDSLSYVLTRGTIQNKDKILNGNSKVELEHGVRISLFDQRKDSTVYEKKFSIYQTVFSHPKRKVSTITEIEGIHPRVSIKDLDQFLIGSMSPKSRYYKQWLGGTIKSKTKG